MYLNFYGFPDVKEHLDVVRDPNDSAKLNVHVGNALYVSMSDEEARIFADTLLIELNRVPSPVAS